MTSHFAHSAGNALPRAFINEKETSGNYLTILHIGAGVGLLGGMFILACAAFLTIFQFFYNENPHGNWLYAVVLPLWILGAYCFDKIEAIDKARRIEYCKKHGMTDQECEKHKSTEENLGQLTI